MSRSRSRTVAAVVATFVAATALVAGPAAADSTVSSYRARGDATALELSVFGQGLSLGVTHAENAHDPMAAASGLGALVPTIGNQVAQTASATSDVPVDDHPEVCGPVSLPPDFPLVDLLTACSSAAAAVTNGLPTSAGRASVGNLTVNGDLILSQLPLKDITDQVETLLGNLEPIFEGVKNDAGLDAESLVSKLIEDITGGGDLVRVTLGPSATNSGVTDAVETADAGAQGATIELLPRDALSTESTAAAVALEPVVKIEVGAAKNTISIDRATGTPTVSYDPALVRVTLAPDIAAALPDAVPNPIEVAPGQEVCLPLPAPLTSCISVAHGTTGVQDGVTYGQASGVSLHLVQGVQGGINLDLAKTRVEGLTAVQTPETPDTPDLARTGGTTDVLMAGSLFALAAGGYLLVRGTRRRTGLL